MHALSRARSTFALAAIAAVCGGGQSVSAQVWNEIGDAPRLAPGQATITDSPRALLTINGALTGGLRGIQADYQDAFCISIVDPAAFSATTIGGALFDTQLWLFDSAGNGIVFNDNSPGAAPIEQSRISNENLQFFSQPGHYTLVISGFDNDAASGLLSPMWLDEPRDTMRAPDGPGAGSPLSGWMVGPTGVDASGAYSIALTGVEYCVVPSPGSAILLGIGAVLMSRRGR